MEIQVMPSPLQSSPALIDWKSQSIMRCWPQWDRTFSAGNMRVISKATQILIFGFTGKFSSLNSTHYNPLVLEFCSFTIIFMTYQHLPAIDWPTISIYYP